ncbi:hypothetical protein BC830DRAFT_809148 [Chytriomyces sp. MP71]|nr:hypothetical protein BC830DRAFT_809148 [Chytriomyces sp. MP71]
MSVMFGCPDPNCNKAGTLIKIASHCTSTGHSTGFQTQLNRDASNSFECPKRGCSTVHANAHAMVLHMKTKGHMNDANVLAMFDKVCRVSHRRDTPVITAKISNSNTAQPQVSTPPQAPSTSCQPPSTSEDLQPRKPRASMQRPSMPIIPLDFNIITSGPQYVDVLHTLHSSMSSVTLSEQRTNQITSLADYFAHAQKPLSLLNQGTSLGNEQTRACFQESALLGSTIDMHYPHQQVHLNVHEPFCLVALGVQGAGKSHTMSVVLESCLLSTQGMDDPGDGTLINIKEPMCALVLHYDQNPTSLCESTGLINPAQILGSNGSLRIPTLSRDKMTVLVSPSYFIQRRNFYGDYCNVRPLLFSWEALSADHIKKLMRINEQDNQLYMATLLDLLRTYQRAARKPTFTEFREQVIALSNVKGQEAPLIQRLNILESFLLESTKNTAIRQYAVDLSHLVTRGNLIVTDLTDPLLSTGEVNAVFQLLVEQFRVAPLAGCGKLLALDECHKFMDGLKGDGLSDAILDTIRLMRHDGIRVVLSTQSPRALQPEILELVSVAVLHRFHSRDWFKYLQAKVPLVEGDFARIVGLDPGEAVVFAGRHLLEEGDEKLNEGVHTWKIGMRPRLTADRGSSRLNK